ncbi:2Fe-2S iron-sulfur cluster-binding protein [Streptomyces sp. NPDC046805]|uniref:2Fe-2S iron-sulfur cluster-binding protein n=1 Tax=Streptomyces sp. NPDC046805 TaxID=3155134 RepID=UPI0033CD671D
MTAEVTYQLPDGTETTIAVDEGQSLMQAAVSNGISGIVAECSGQLMCATCHVYVEDGADHLPQRSADEGDMLELAAAPVTAQSRLSCQLVVGSDPASLRVIVPEKQV